jgi:hypothetical protein
MRNACNILVGNSEWKRPLGRTTPSWEDVTRYLREIGWESVDGMHMAQDRDQWRALVNTEMNLWLPYNAENFLTK